MLALVEFDKLSQSVKFVTTRRSGFLAPKRVNSRKRRSQLVV